MRFLLDTNVVSETMRITPARRLLQKLAHHEGQLAISSVTWQELVYGVARLPDGPRRRALAVRLADFRDVLPPPLPFTVEAAEWLGHELARLERRGIRVTCEDGRIAAVAWSSNLTLVTANTKHLARFEGLDVVDWTR